MKLIVGLGNPGNKYKNTRHNVGWLAVDALARRLDLSWQENKKFKAAIAKGNDFILVKPLAYMNNSGEAVAAVLSYYKLLPSPLEGAPPASLAKALRAGGWGEVLTVIHDDLDIDFGKYKIAADSRSAGHNGVQSIIDRLGTKNFTRYRLGIKNGKATLMDAEKFVLQNFSREETERLNILLPEIVDKLIG